MSNWKYVVAKPFATYSVGDRIKVRGLVVINNVVHAETDTVNIPISKLEKPQIGRNLYSDTNPEDEQIANIKRQIELYKCDRVRVNGTDYEIDGIEKVSLDLCSLKRSPKADFVFVKNNEPVYFGSLKKSPFAIHYNGYGGITEYKDHNVVQSFKDKLTPIIDENRGIDEAFCIGYKLQMEDLSHHELARMILFGKDTKNIRHSWNNINAIHHGWIRLERDGSSYFLQSEDDVFNDSTIKDIELMLFARFSTDRSNLGFKNTRITCGRIGSRKVDLWV